ncbi:sugar ABC transporter substrate-binding protein [Xylanibacillus composti]|uniref:Sugar ABC transporter substrate-binding protein n=1 Tax=Xylanibacillus composti TaxID=1572762 RepID=A0A8J4H5N5_9BACL|nr:substrate-binding domain-containing protein [Xylanibacillus composti]MDT9723698.1 sugar ABC transporter substrate-binding protein [Xylanibacillus composti]GIQ71417.1 sugar ABC transporter substrate-binding protein [Xylanibacillus composti]
MKKMTGMLVFILMLAVVVTGCGNNGGAPSNNGGGNNAGSNGAGSSEGGASVDEIAQEGPLTINLDLPDNPVLSTGPNGEEAVSAKTLMLTEEELEELRAGNYTAAISLHYAGNDWSTAQVKGLQAAFARMGIEVIATTDANFKSEKQMSDIETLMARNPDVLVSIPVDAVTTATAYKKVVENGTKLVFMDNKPDGLEHGTDYVSVVSADNYGNGVVAAHIMADQLGGEGNIGVIYHDADFFVTKQRTEAFEKTIAEEYPNINIVERGGIAGPEDGEAVASALLTKNPNLDGLFVVWDVPAEGALSAVRIAGREDLVITTIDLGTNVALNIAQGGNIKGLGAQLPYDQGVAEAILAGYALLGKETPPYVAVPSLEVTQENILESWKTVYYEEAPNPIQQAAAAE